MREIVSQRKAGKRKVPTEAMKRRALWDFWTFVDMINFQGGRTRFGECHFEMIEWYNSFSMEGKRTMVQMPRGHLKSTLLTVATTLHDIYINPNIRIFVGTSTRPLATSFVREIKQYLEDTWLQEHVWNSRPHIEGNLIPVMDKAGLQRRRQSMDDDYTEAQDKKVVWRTDALQVLRPYILKEPTVTVGSVGTAATGYHYDKLKLDDVVTYENATSPARNEKRENWIAELESVLDPEWYDEWLAAQLPKEARHYAHVGGQISIVGTAQVANDWYCQIENDAEELGYQIYKRNIYVNGEDNTDGYIWPEKWNLDLEIKTRARLTTRRFASQYLNRILAEENSHLNHDTALFLHAANISLSSNGECVVKLPDDDDPVTIKLFLAIDPAAALSAKSDYTAMVVGGRDKKKRLIVVDYEMGRWPTSLLIKTMYGLIERWNLRAAHIEQVGGFKHLGGAIKMAFQQYRPIGVVEHRPTGSKEERILNGLEPLFKNNMVYLPASIRKRKDICDQLDMFGAMGMHDDFPDALEILSSIAAPPMPKAQSPLSARRNKLYGGYR